VLYEEKQGLIFSDTARVFISQLTLHFEGEMCREVATLVVAAKHEQSRRKVQLQREQIENALQSTQH